MSPRPLFNFLTPLPEQLLLSFSCAFLRSFMHDKWMYIFFKPHTYMHRWVHVTCTVHQLFFT